MWQPPPAARSVGRSQCDYGPGIGDGLPDRLPESPAGRSLLQRISPTPPLCNQLRHLGLPVATESCAGQGGLEGPEPVTLGDSPSARPLHTPRPP